MGLSGNVDGPEPQFRRVRGLRGARKGPGSAGKDFSASVRQNHVDCGKSNLSETDGGVIAEELIILSVTDGGVIATFFNFR